MTGAERRAAELAAQFELGNREAVRDELRGMPPAEAAAVGFGLARWLGSGEREVMGRLLTGDLDDPGRCEDLGIGAKAYLRAVLRHHGPDGLGLALSALVGDALSGAEDPERALRDVADELSIFQSGLVRCRCGRRRPVARGCPECGEARDG